MNARAWCLGTILAIAVGCACLTARPAMGQVTPVSNVDPSLTARYEAQIRERLSEVEEIRRAGRPAAPLAGTDDVATVMSPGQQAAIQQGMDQPLQDSRGTEIAPTTVIGLLLIRDMFILQAEWMADYLESIRDGGVGDKRARLSGICEVAPELARLHAEWRDAELAYNSHLGSLGEAGQISEETARAHTREADRLKQEADAKKRAFEQALDEAQARFPEINGEVDGIPLWQALDCGKTDRQGEQDRIDIYNRYLTRGIEDLRNRAEAARLDDTADELWKYRRPEYQGIRNGVRRQGESVNSQLPSYLMDEVEKVGGAYDIHVAVDEGWTKVILAGIGVVGVLISPVVCLTVSVIDVTMEGDQLIVAFKDAEEARMAEPVLGWRHVITAEERARAANGEFVLAAIGVGLDGAAIRSMKVVGAADCPRDLARAGDAADAGRVGDAAAAGRVADAPPKRWGHLGDATVDEAFGHPNIPDDAWVHFGGSEIADGIRQDGVLGRSYWGRWGEVKNWTQGELRFNIGSMSKSGLSDLKTMVVAPDNAPIRVKRGEYGFEVEGVTDETIQGGRVIVVDDPAAAAGRAGAADAGRADAPGAPGAPQDPPGPPRAGDVARGAPEPGGLRPEDVDHWRRNEAERIERDRGYGIERADETDAKLERFEESIQAATDAGIPRADIDEALDAVRRKQVSIPSEGQTGLDVAIKDFRIRMVIKEAIRKDITIVLRETDRVHLDALGGGNAKVIVLEPADANLVIAKAAMDRGQGAGTWTAAEADLARRLQRENPEKLYVFDPEQFEGGLYPLMDADDAANLSRIFGPDARPPQVVDRGPGGPPPDLPPRQLDPEADTSLEAGRARQPADDRPPDHETQRLTPEEMEEELRDAPTVRLPGDADQADAAPLPGPPPGNQPGEIRAAPLDGKPADGPPAGAGNVPRAAEAGNVPAPDAGQPPQDAPLPPARGADEVGAAPGVAPGAADGPQVASVGTTFQHTISPIDFYMFPVLDLSDQTYTAINFPVTLATGRDVRIQIVILSGPPAEEGTTRERRPGDPQPDRSTGTSWIGESDAVPGGGILFYEADPKVLVRSLGTLGGGAMEMQVFGAEPGQERISAEGLVVEPVELGAEMKQRLEQEVRALAGQNPITATLDAYCLDFLRQPPDAGTVFRIADQELQQRFAPLREVLQAGRKLHELGLLNPDSDPEEYFHSIRQWALWSVQENLDAGSFGDAFLEHTRKNFETAGQAWTEEIEGLVKGLVPNRWQDIARILEEARTPSDAVAGSGGE